MRAKSRERLVAQGEVVIADGRGVQPKKVETLHLGCPMEEREHGRPFEEVTRVEIKRPIRLGSFAGKRGGQPRRAADSRREPRRTETTRRVGIVDFERRVEEV